jgi:hypothetical protein
MMASRRAHDEEAKANSLNDARNQKPSADHNMITE